MPIYAPRMPILLQPIVRFVAVRSCGSHRDLIHSKVHTF
jgi:hypothetical protein